MAGSNPTFDECFTQLGLATKAINALQLFGFSNTPNWLDMEDALRVAIDGVYTPGLISMLEAGRRTIAAPLSREALQAVWRPFLLEICRAVDLPELGQSNVAMLTALRQYMVDNDKHIKSRGMTLGTPSADGGNAGNTTLFRCTVDKDSFPLECTGAEAKRAECTADHNSGARKSAELWRFKGTPAGDTSLQWEGSGLDLRGVVAAHPASGRILRNASFDTNGASADDTAPATTTSITGWTVTTAANWKCRSASGYYYATYPGAPSTLWGLQCTASDAITQVVSTANPGAAFDPTKPYFCSVRWMRKSSATGTITLYLGAKSASATIGSASNDAWNHLYIAVDDDAFFQNFDEQALDIKVEVSTLAVGTVVIDHVTLDEMVNVDGTFYLPVAGNTAALRDDFFTWTDTDGSRAINSYWLWQAHGPDGWLPAVANATQVSASGGRTLTFANSGSADTITASSGSFVSDGYKEGMLVTIAGTSSNNMTTGPIVTVTATVLTFGATTSLTNEGPLSATATLNATCSNLDPT